jgi:hypothetical protein
LEFAEPEEAHRAVAQLHGTQVLGQNIRVELSIPKHLKPPKWKQPDYRPVFTKPKFPLKSSKGFPLFSLFFLSLSSPFFGFSSHLFCFVLFCFV